jgi:hypothetical protein
MLQSGRPFFSGDEMLKRTLAGCVALIAVSACGPSPQPGASTAPTQTPAAIPAPAPTTQSRLGALNFEKGFPTEETTQKLFDELDYQRAVQAYLWAYPAVSFESIRLGTSRDLGADLNDLIIADNFADPKGRWLTANDTTIYALANVDLGKSGPVVVEIPPGLIVGLIDDFWQRSISDVGVPGPDGVKGGKFLLVPPGYQGNAPQSGYHVLPGTMNNYNLMVRGIVQDNDKDAAVQNVKRVKVYPLSESSNPKPNRFLSMSGKVMDTTPPTGMAYWELLAAFINNNPVQERDLFYMAMLKPLGIEKGKAFTPNTRQRKILEEAAQMGDAMGRVMLFEGPDRFRKFGEGLGVEPFPGTKWHWVFQVNPVQKTDTYGQIDERLHYTRRDLHDPRTGRDESRSRRELRSGIQGQGRQPPRWRKVVSSARACERAGRAVLVADAL